MCCRATLAIEVSSTSMNAASATVAAISQGLVRGFHVACTIGAGAAGLAGAAASDRATPDTGTEPAGVLGWRSANHLLLGTDSALPFGEVRGKSAVGLENVSSYREVR